MARTTIHLKVRDAQMANRKMVDILERHNYEQINEKGELVWKCGIGFWTAIKYIKLEYAASDSLILSGWIRPVGGAEQSLEGFVGALPKKQILNLIKEIQDAVC